MMARRRRQDDLSPRSRSSTNLRPLILSVLVIGALGLLGYWFFNPQSAPGWLRDYVPEAPTRLYKWTDSQGKLQYSNSPPPTGVKYELVDYWENANVIPSQPPGE